MEATLRSLLFHAGEFSYHAWFLQKLARYAEGSVGIDPEMILSLTDWLHLTHVRKGR